MHRIECETTVGRAQTELKVKTALAISRASTTPDSNSKTVLAISEVKTTPNLRGKLY